MVCHYIYKYAKAVSAHKKHRYRHAFPYLQLTGTSMLCAQASHELVHSPSRLKLDWLGRCTFGTNTSPSNISSNAQLEP